MAIYHFDVSITQRSKGQSAVAKAAYNSRSKLIDERTDTLYNYSRKQDLEFSEILLPTNAPKWAADRQNLWSQAELAENRKNSQPAKQIIVALPQELTSTQNQQLVRDFVLEELVDLGMAADVNIHQSHTAIPNPHAHILLTARGFEGEEFAKKKNRDWFNRDHLKRLRAKWADHVNKNLTIHGSQERVDHRSWKDKGIERIPQIHLGPAASAMARKGIVTEKLKTYNAIEATNAKLGQIAKEKEKLAAEQAQAERQKQIRQRQEQEKVQQQLEALRREQKQNEQKRDRLARMEAAQAEREKSQPKKSFFDKAFEFLNQEIKLPKPKPKPQPKPQPKLKKTRSLNEIIEANRAEVERVRAKQAEEEKTRLANDYLSKLRSARDLERRRQVGYEPNLDREEPTKAEARVPKTTAEIEQARQIELAKSQQRERSLAIAPILRDYINAVKQAEVETKNYRVSWRKEEQTLYLYRKEAAKPILKVKYQNQKFEPLEPVSTPENQPRLTNADVERWQQFAVQIRQASEQRERQERSQKNKRRGLSR